ncbi:hypothetical protein B0H13DRAFT_2513259 [Mycena leptocephala]|nr:hypothetical protein B0H13DRAFT_2513259 [Mycena leptocephala]
MDASLCSECGASSTGRPPALDAAVAPASGTRHHTLLNSNEPPEDAELPFISSVISNTDAPLAFLDEEISKLQDQLERLEKDRASLLSYRTRHCAILSPLRRMPLEVLGEIFSWTLPSLSDAMDQGRFDMTESPWVLTQISSGWRETSLSTPFLWSHFLARHSLRWEELSLGLTPELLPSLSALRDQVPSLRRLWLEWDGSEIETVETIDCFQTASALVDASVGNDLHFLSITLPIHQLTRYQLNGPWEIHQGILKLAPNLVEARIELNDEDRWPDSTEIIDLLRLRRLYVSNVRALKYIRVPALEELALWIEETEDSDLRTLFHSLLDRSSCRLRRVCLRGSPTAGATTEILQNFSFVTELVFINDCYAREEVDSLMTTLTIPNLAGSTAIAPQLSLMYFGCSDKDCIDYSVYLSMLKSRWKAEGCALKAAALLTSLGPGPDASILQGLRALRREGLDLLLLEGEDAKDEMFRLAHIPVWIQN